MFRKSERDASQQIQRLLAEETKWIDVGVTVLPIENIKEIFIPTTKKKKEGGVKEKKLC